MPGTIRWRRSALLLLLLSLVACSNATPFATTVGILHPGATLTVRVAQGAVNAYQPAAGESRNRFTIEATAGRGAQPSAPHLRAATGGTLVEAKDPLATLLVRVPDGVNLVVESQRGDVNVTDIKGTARIVAQQGNVRVFVRDGYAQAETGDGNINVAMGAVKWPGTLHFTARHGDVEIAIEETAACRVHLVTDNGTLFTDFNLLGTSNGTAETIDGVINGGGNSVIDVHVERGSIRLLRLHAQA